MGMGNNDQDCASDDAGLPRRNVFNKYAGQDAWLGKKYLIY
jgi:hypothetical protein